MTVPETGEGFPWRGVMAFGLRRLAPRDFWALTVPELLAMASGAETTTRPSASDLADLMRLFPDTPTPEET